MQLKKSFLSAIFCFALLLAGCSKHQSSVSYPRIFRAWSGIEDTIFKGNETENYAKHDLCFGSISGLLGLEWQLDDSIKYEGLATKISEKNLQAATDRKAELLKLNPRMLLLATIEYRDAYYGSGKDSEKVDFPPDSPFWLRDSSNNVVIGWAEDTNVDGVIDRKDDTPWGLADFTNEKFQDILADKALAVKNTGLFEGIFLDWWKERGATAYDIMEPESGPVLSDILELAARINILKKIREKTGNDFLILVNANYDTIPLSAPYVNGAFMECYRDDFMHGYTTEEIHKMETSLAWHERNLKKPVINCLEGWRVVQKYDDDPKTRFAERNSEENKRSMRMITSLGLTHSDGYVLFSDPNELPCGDHLHNWYDFWDAQLGSPVSPKSVKYENTDGLYIREFDNGWVVYNNSGSEKEITLPGKATGLTSRLSGTRHRLPNLDGEIYLRN